MKRERMKIDRNYMRMSTDSVDSVGSCKMELETGTDTDTDTNLGLGFETDMNIESEFGFGFGFETDMDTEFVAEIHSYNWSVGTNPYNYRQTG